MVPEAVLDHPDLGREHAYRGLQAEAVIILPQLLDLLDADHPLPGVAEVPDKRRDRLGGRVYALLDEDRTFGLGAQPQPNSSRRSSSKPKWWAISWTTVILICSSSCSGG